MCFDVPQHMKCDVDAHGDGVKGIEVEIIR